MELNSCQQSAYDAITSAKYKYLVVDGEGGTGKSVVLAQCLMYHLVMNEEFTVVAPSHQAAASLQEKIDEVCGNLDPLGAQTTVRTIQSLCRQFAFNDEYGEMRFANANGDHLTRDKVGDVLYIDELSMVSKEQTDELLKGGFRIVAFGDQAQLPPVRAKESTLWSTSLAHRFTLRTQMRNGGEIYKVAHANRKLPTIPQHSKGNVTVYSTQSKLLSSFFTALSTTAHPENCVYLAFRNKTVDAVAVIAHTFAYGAVPVNHGQIMLLAENIPHIQSKGHLIRVVEVLSKERTNGITYWNVRAAHVNKPWREKTIAVTSPVNQRSIDSKIKELREKIRIAADFGLVEAEWEYREEIEELKTMVVRTSSPFAMTTHKSQGLSIPNVWVDSDDIGLRRDLLYVAFSRAKIHLHTIK